MVRFTISSSHYQHQRIRNVADLCTANLYFVEKERMN